MRILCSTKSNESGRYRSGIGSSTTTIPTATFQSSHFQRCWLKPWPKSLPPSVLSSRLPWLNVVFCHSGMRAPLSPFHSNSVILVPELKPKPAKLNFLHWTRYCAKGCVNMRACLKIKCSRKALLNRFSGMKSRLLAQQHLDQMKAAKQAKKEAAAKAKSQGSSHKRSHW